MYMYIIRDRLHMIFFISLNLFFCYVFFWIRLQNGFVVSDGMRCRRISLGYGHPWTAELTWFGLRGWSENMVSLG